MANLSSFPQNIDTFVEHQDISYLDVTSIKRYQELRMKQNISPQDQAELNNLTQALITKIFTAGHFNHMQDAIVNLETFFRDNVEGYIGIKQDEFEAMVEAFYDEILQFTHVGYYNHTTTYRRFNVVSWYNDLVDDMPHLYCALQNSTNRQPDLWPDYWMQLTIKGDKGEAGRDGFSFIFVGAYENDRQYTMGQAVQYGGFAFGSLKDSQGIPPDLTQDTEYWGKVWDLGMTINKLNYYRSLATPATRIVFVGGDISAYNPATDVLEVYRNGLKQAEGQDYKINSDMVSIDIIGSGWAGNIEFVVTRNQINNLVFSDGNAIADGTINVNKFTERLQDAMLYAQYLYETSGYDFDNFSNRPGEVYLTQFDTPETGDIMETIKTMEGEIKAQRRTQFDVPEQGNITVTLVVPDHGISVKQVTKFDDPETGDISQYVEKT